MCLAVPMKVMEIDGKVGLLEVGGVKKKADLQLLPDAKIGDYVIVHAGFAIQKLDEEEAKKTLEIFDEIYR